MRKKIAWTDQAKADLRAINQTTALQILHRIAHYLATGEGDIKRLQAGYSSSRGCRWTHPCPETCFCKRYEGRHCRCDAEQAWARLMR